ncbi:lipoate-protein ligase B [Bradyrhizobium sp. JR6.1]
MRTRSPRSAYGCAAGSRSTVIAINVEPDLSHFQAIVPCGVVDPRYGVTSLVDLGLPVTMADVDIALRQAFTEVFGDTAARLPEATV